MYSTVSSACATTAVSTTCGCRAGCAPTWKISGQGRCGWRSSSHSGPYGSCSTRIRLGSHSTWCAGPPTLPTWVRSRSADSTVGCSPAHATYEITGECEGWVSIGGDRIELTRTSSSFFRNHSWGFQPPRGRPTAHGAPVPNKRVPGRRQWVLFHTPSHGGFFFEDPSGRAAAGQGRDPRRRPRSYPWSDIATELEFHDGGRRRRGRFRLTDVEATVRDYEFEDLGWVYCQGGGYFGGFDDGLGQGVLPRRRALRGRGLGRQPPDDDCRPVRPEIRVRHDWAESFTLAPARGTTGLAHYECVRVQRPVTAATYLTSAVVGKMDRSTDGGSMIAIIGHIDVDPACATDSSSPPSSSSGRPPATNPAASCTRWPPTPASPGRISDRRAVGVGRGARRPLPASQLPRHRGRAAGGTRPWRYGHEVPYRCRGPGPRDRRNGDRRVRAVNEIRQVDATRRFEPTEHYRAWRADCPVITSDHDPPFYVLTTFDDVVAVLKQPGLWNNRDGPGVLYQKPGVLGSADDPDHGRHRQVLRTSFVPTVINRQEPQLRAIAGRADRRVRDRRALRLRRAVRGAVPGTRHRRPARRPRR